MKWDMDHLSRHGDCVQQGGGHLWGLTRIRTLHVMSTRDWFRVGNAVEE